MAGDEGHAVGRVKAGAGDCGLDGRDVLRQGGRADPGTTEPGFCHSARKKPPAVGPGDPAKGTPLGAGANRDRKRGAAGESLEMPKGSAGGGACLRYVTAHANFRPGTAGIYGAGGTGGKPHPGRGRGDRVAMVTFFEGGELKFAPKKKK